MPIELEKSEFKNFRIAWLKILYSNSETADYNENRIICIEFIQKILELASNKNKHPEKNSSNWHSILMQSLYIGFLLDMVQFEVFSQNIIQENIKIDMTNLDKYSIQHVFLLGLIALNTHSTDQALKIYQYILKEGHKLTDHKENYYLGFDKSRIISHVYLILCLKFDFQIPIDGHEKFISYHYGKYLFNHQSISYIHFMDAAALTGCKDQVNNFLLEQSQKFNGPQYHYAVRTQDYDTIASLLVRDTYVLKICFGYDFPYFNKNPHFTELMYKVFRKIKDTAFDIHFASTLFIKLMDLKDIHEHIVIDDYLFLLQSWEKLIEKNDDELYLFHQHIECIINQLPNNEQYQEIHNKYVDLNYNSYQRLQENLHPPSQFLNL